MNGDLNVDAPDHNIWEIDGEIVGGPPSGEQIELQIGKSAGYCREHCACPLVMWLTTATKSSRATDISSLQLQPFLRKGPIQL